MAKVIHRDALREVQDKLGEAEAHIKNLQNEIQEKVSKSIDRNSEWAAENREIREKASASLEDAIVRHKSDQQQIRFYIQVLLAIVAYNGDSVRTVRELAVSAIEEVLPKEPNVEVK